MAVSVPSRRKFPETLKKGQPNLVVVDPGKCCVFVYMYGTPGSISLKYFVHGMHCAADVLKTTLALYMEDANLPMPTHEEVLVCSERTTEEEITLLWKRAMGDPNYFRIFTLVHAEKLSYQTCDKALKSLSELSQGRKGLYELLVRAKKKSVHCT